MTFPYQPLPADWAPASGEDNVIDEWKDNPLLWLFIFVASVLLVLCGFVQAQNRGRPDAYQNQFSSLQTGLVPNDRDCMEQKRKAALQALPVHEWELNETSVATIAEPSGSARMAGNVSGKTAGSVKLLLLSISRKMRSRRRSEQQEECALCLSAFQNGEKVTTLPCGHFYHHDCIHAWFDAQQYKDRFCPLCKRSPLQADGSLFCPEATAPLVANTPARHIHVDIPIAPPERHEQRDATDAAPVAPTADQGCATAVGPSAVPDP